MSSRSFSIRRVLRGAWSTWKKHYWMLLGVMILGWIASAVVQGMLYFMVALFPLLYVVISVVVSLFVMYVNFSVLNFFIQAARGRPLSLEKAFPTLRQFGQFLLHILIVFGFVLLSIAIIAGFGVLVSLAYPLLAAILVTILGIGIFLVLVYFFFAPFLILEGHTVIPAIRQSFRLVHHRFGKILLLALVAVGLMVISVIPAGLFILLSYVVGPGMFILGGLIAIVTGFIMMVYLRLLSPTLYVQVSESHKPNASKTTKKKPAKKKAATKTAASKSKKKKA